MSIFPKFTAQGDLCSFCVESLTRKLSMPVSPYAQISFLYQYICINLHIFCRAHT